jgi:hypothetical protein
MAAMRMGGVVGGWGRQGKAFFFAKKKQKTLTNAVADFSGERATADQKFFGSFFQKRTCFLSPHQICRN